mmetsp:Transcript_682/g.1678  ORF Transcript_682/g.1678 Transcript_682/m.1678 type:complete len:279 (+) Transcript_682:31-867(+)
MKTMQGRSHRAPAPSLPLRRRRSTREAVTKKQINYADDGDGHYNNLRAFIEDYLLRNQLVRFEMKADGNCLFRSIAHQLKNNKFTHQSPSIDHRNVRMDTVAYIEAHLHDFVGFIAVEGEKRNIHDNDDERLAAMLAGTCQRFRRSGVWEGLAEDLLVHAASMFYNLQIIIHEPTISESNRYPLIIEPLQSSSSAATSSVETRAIHLLRATSEHYDSVLPTASASTSASTSMSMSAFVSKETHSGSVLLPQRNRFDPTKTASLSEIPPSQGEVKKDVP